MTEGLKTVKHRIIEKGHSVLLIDEDPQWIIPSACMSVAFYANPKEVLKYGSNGLHFAEHILWNMIARNNLRQTNASTFNTGEMAVFGICLENEFASSMTAFFNGLLDLSECKLSTSMRSTFITEQRRVTCETDFMQETSFASEVKREREKMFIFNTDMVKAQYSPDYVWKILLEECTLGKVVIMAHCHLKDEDIHLFEELAGKFQKAWDGREKFIPKKVLLPVYHAPPFSMFQPDRHGSRANASSLRAQSEPSSNQSEGFEIVYDDSIGPIERAIISTGLSPKRSPYLFSVDVHVGIAALSSIKQVYLKSAYYWADPYFAMPILTSYQGALKQEWVDDLYSKSAREIVKKYDKKAITILANAIKAHRV